MLLLTIDGIEIPIQPSKFLPITITSPQFEIIGIELRIYEPMWLWVFKHFTLVFNFLYTLRHLFRGYITLDIIKIITVVTYQCLIN